MKFREVIDSPCGLRYMFEALELSSGVARTTMLAREMMLSQSQIEQCHIRIAEFENEFKGNAEPLQRQLSKVKDISGTLTRLKDGATLDEVALFEIKELCLIAEDIITILERAKIESITIPSLTEPLSLLDPENQRVSSFYIYDIYSEKLKEFRASLTRSVEKKEELFIAIYEEEYKVRNRLSAKLKCYANVLSYTLAALVETDITLAKALQKAKMRLVIPSFSVSGKTIYMGLFHPQTKHLLAQQGKEFQPVDFEFNSRPTTIIGANMGGKTLVLKMTALAQYLFQFGFAVPAESAEIDIKESVRLFIGAQESAGLSSFASEVVYLNETISLSKSGQKILALLDEPAHTTNPVEGTALVSALVEIIKDTDTDLVITTHYNLNENVSRRLKVEGLIDGVMNYALQETSSSQVPHEAINTARTLNADREWLWEAERILKNK